MEKTILLDRYEILEKIGHGGFSKVYKAFDNRVERVVAIKKISKSPKTIVRALREAKTTSLLNHPNIVTVYDFQEHEDNYYLIMEYVAGTPLAKILQEKRALTINQTLAIAIQVCEALECAHINNVIHRDIKPANLVLVRDGRVKVMDFGIARLKGQPDTTERSILGTLAYMSPEQVQGEYVDETTDVYSLGVVVYEMLTKASPFEAGAAGAVIYKILNTDSPSPSGLNSKVPIDLDRVVMKAMSKEPSDRFETTTVMRYKLERLTPASFNPRKVLKPLILGEEEAEEEESLGGWEGFKDHIGEFVTKHQETLKRIIASLLAGASFFLAIQRFGLYPEALVWVILSLIGLVTLLKPSLGVALLMVSLIPPIGSFSPVIAILFTAFSVIYWVLLVRKFPLYSLLPLLAPVFAGSSLEFLFPLLIGFLFPPLWAFILAALGCLGFELYILFTGHSALTISMLRQYNLLASLEGSANIVKDISSLFSPFLKSPYFLLQVLVWALAAVSVSLIARKKGPLKDSLGILAGALILALGTTILPQRMGIAYPPLDKVVEVVSLTLMVMLVLVILVPYRHLKMLKSRRKDSASQDEKA